MCCLKSSSLFWLFSFFYIEASLLHFSVCTSLEHRMILSLQTVIVNISFNPHWGDGVMGKHRHSKELE